MEPIAEPPRAAAQPAPAPPRPPVRSQRSAPPARDAPARRPCGRRTLLLLALLGGVGVGAYVIADRPRPGSRACSSSATCQGNVEQAVDEIQGLIDENTALSLKVPAPL